MEHLIFVNAQLAEGEGTRKALIDDGASRWLRYAMFGLGFCLAGTEAERYTSLWAFSVRPAWEFIAILALFVVVIAVMLHLRSGEPERMYRSVSLLAILAACGTVGICVRVCYTLGMLPASVMPISGLLMVSMFVLFIIYAIFFFVVNIRKSLVIFGGASMVAGVVQLVTAVLPFEIAIVITLLLPSVSVVLLLLSQRARTDQQLEEELEDLEAERAWGSTFVKGFTFPRYCVMIGAYVVLMIALHVQGMSLQDGGMGSFAIQMMSACGGVALGLLLLVFLRFLKDYELLNALRVVVLPILLVAMYLSLFLAYTHTAVYLVLLEIVHLVITLFVWTAPNAFSGVGALRSVCWAFLASRIGWAIGNLALSILPGIVDAPVGDIVIIASLAVVVLLSIMPLIGQGEGAKANSSESQKTEKDVHDMFLDACDEVAAEHGLTRREREVLAYLARGRNAQHIANALVISDGTARTHIMHIYQKLSVNSQQQLINLVEDKIVELRDAR